MFLKTAASKIHQEHHQKLYNNILLTSSNFHCLFLTPPTHLGEELFIFILFFFNFIYLFIYLFICGGFCHTLKWKRRARESEGWHAPMLWRLAESGGSRAQRPRLRRARPVRTLPPGSGQLSRPLGRGCPWLGRFPYLTPREQRLFQPGKVMFFKFIFNWRITALQCHIGHSGGRRQWDEDAF